MTAPTLTGQQVEPGPSGSPSGEQDAFAADLHVVRRLHVGRWVAAAAIFTFCGWLGYVVGTNKNIRWSAVGAYFTDASILRGLVVTIELTVIAMAIGLVLGILLALMRISANPVLKAASNFYIWIFRGTPLLVQIIFWYNIALIFPRLWLFGFYVSTNTVITTFGAAILALGLNEGAYMSEIVRAGIMSVAHGQMDAALSIGLTRRQAMRHVVLPQALRVIVPPFGNQTIGMLKTTSLVSVIAAQDLLTRAQNIYGKNFEVIELLIVASLWYLVLTTIASVGQYFIEQRFAAGAVRSQTTPGLLDAIRNNLLSAPRLLRRGTGL